MAKPAPKPDNLAQSQRFSELAAELGLDGNLEDFERAFRKVATAKREAPPKPKKREKR